MKLKVMSLKLKPVQYIELVFDLFYLVFVTVAGLVMLLKANGNNLLWMYGLLALILVFGDSFHLLPRVYSLLTNTFAENIRALGIGKMLTSITMTVFYLILYFFWQRFYQIELPLLLTIIVLMLAIIRIVLCLLPQNGWCKKNPSFQFALYRNVPFAILGIIVTMQFAISALLGVDSFTFMWLAIVLSFICYFIVVLGAAKNPKLGMLMLPKTCAYIWIICMGLTLL